MFDINQVDRNVELFIFDIYVAILKIEYIVQDFSDAEKLLHDFRSWDSVIREFEIIGEACKYLLKDAFALFEAKEYLSKALEKPGIS